MSHSYKPDGYTSVSPYLIVDGASRAMVDCDSSRMRVISSEAVATGAEILWLFSAPLP